RIYRDGFGPGGGGVEKCASAFQRAGETDGLDRGMPNQVKAHLMRGAMDERKNSCGHLCRYGGGLDGMRDQFRSAGVGRVRLYYHRVPGGERGGGVAARDGK